MFFIIFGTRGITSTKGQGRFTCPGCGPNSSYELKSVRRFFTLYFIPLIPLDSLGEYIECNHCQATFNENVLSYRPTLTSGSNENQLQMRFMIAMKQVMIGMLLADGTVRDSEVKELQNIFGELADVQITLKDLHEEIGAIKLQNVNCLEMMASIAPSLNDGGKEKVVRAAYRIAMADNVFADQESEYLCDLSAALDISQSHLRDIMSVLMK